MKENKYSVLSCEHKYWLRSGRADGLEFVTAVNLARVAFSAIYGQGKVSDVCEHFWGAEVSRSGDEGRQGGEDGEPGGGPRTQRGCPRKSQQ